MGSDIVNALSSNSTVSIPGLTASSAKKSIQSKSRGAQDKRFGALYKGRKSIGDKSIGSGLDMYPVAGEELHGRRSEQFSKGPAASKPSQCPEICYLFSLVGKTVLL